MPTCSLCSETIGRDQLDSSSRGVLRHLGLGDLPVTNVFSAVQCDRCGIWLCNDCISRKVPKLGSGELRHSGCGGTFRSP